MCVCGSQSRQFVTCVNFWSTGVIMSPKQTEKRSHTWKRHFVPQSFVSIKYCNSLKKSLTWIKLDVLETWWNMFSQYLTYLHFVRAFIQVKGHCVMFSLNTPGLFWRKKCWVITLKIHPSLFECVANCYFGCNCNIELKCALSTRQVIWITQICNCLFSFGVSSSILETIR